jgi:NitT/TauT family transport system ATP-binding protein
VVSVKAAAAGTAASSERAVVEKATAPSVDHPRAALPSRAPKESVRTVIRCEDVHKFYLAGPQSVYALQGINLDIREREFVSIVGKSGCGKSTLLHCIAGLLPVSHGEIAINGERVVKPGRRDVGLVFQTSALLRWRTALENVLLPAEMFGLPRHEIEPRVRDLLRLVDLEGFEKQYPNQLSGGMQQRVAIARALVHDPSVLLMDEPFGALDAYTRENMTLELMRIWEATPKTVFFVTHDLQEAAFLSNRVVVMTARPGTIQEIVEVPIPHPRTRDVLYTSEFLHTVRHLRELLVAQRNGER